MGFTDASRLRDEEDELSLPSRFVVLVVSVCLPPTETLPSVSPPTWVLALLVFSVVAPPCGTPGAEADWSLFTVTLPLPGWAAFGCFSGMFSTSPG